MPDINDKNTQDAIAGIYYGNLAHRINKNMKYAASGVMIGAVSGVIVATLMGKCRLCLGFWGAVAGGGVGYLTSKK